MDNKDFVPFQTAKKLKAAGFDEPCSVRWECEPDDVPSLYSSVFSFKNKELEGLDFTAPTLWQAQKWLREVKGIDITISVYREIDETVSPRIIKRSYECEITTEDDEDYIPYIEDEKNFPSYEAALSAGIDTALDLIINKTERK